MTEDKKTLSLAEKHELAKAEIAELLSNYELGWDLFKKTDDWSNFVVMTQKGKDSPDLEKVPRGRLAWMGLAERVCEIIAKRKYGLDTYRNEIEIVDADQMLMAYSSIGMPVNYEHWSFGMQMIQEKKQYEAGRMGLAYEIVINTNPSIAYCMEGNTKMMQLLVIAHASFGHNSFFKGNHLFKQFTDPEAIIPQLKRLREAQMQYEEKYGVEEVTAVLDAVHALRNIGVSRLTRPPRRTAADEKQRLAELEEARQRSYNDVVARTISKKVANDFDAAGRKGPEVAGEENILRFIAQNAPHMEPWKRDLVMKMADINQYFYPQRQTQVMNEGWATFWHHRIINDLYDMDLIDDGMMLEFIKSHTSVTAQPTIGHPAYSGFNPYALGFAMYTDIKRICEDPTPEDRQYFEWAGNPDWVAVLHDAMESCKDESFISQYLSPKMIRDFRLFAVRDDDQEENLVVDAIHDDEGYRRVRRHLSAQYNIGAVDPNVEVADYDYKASRTLTLRHKMHNGRPLNDDPTQKTLNHLHYLWGHPVVLQSMTSEGKVDETYAYPAGAQPPKRMLVP
jgi:stage V sporulation protein R